MLQLVNRQLRAAAGLTVGLFFLHQVTQACSPPPPLAYFGPSFGPPRFFTFFPRSAPDVTTTNDPNILTAVLQIFDQFEGSNVDRELPVMIDLTTGAVTPRSPNIVDRPVPESTVNSADGLSFVFDGNSVIISNTAQVLRNIRIDLEVGEPFSLMPVARYNGDLDAAFPLFFSNAVEKAFLLYETVLNCTDATISITLDLCGDAQFPLEEEILSFVTIIDLDTGAHQTQSLPFRRLPWEFALFGGFPNNEFQFRRIWDSVQIVDDGIEAACGDDGPGLFFYSEEGLVTIPDGFDLQSFNSLAPGSTSPQDLEAFRVVPTLVTSDDLRSAGLPEFFAFPSGFVIERYSVASGEILQSYDLDADEIWALVQLEQPDFTAPPSPVATDPPVPGPAPTTPPPVRLTQAPQSAPVTLPSASLAPFPTIPIAFPFPQPVTVPTPVSAPTPPTPTTFAPAPTIPIAFPVSFPSELPAPTSTTTFAPVPTIPIAFPVSFPTTPAPPVTMPVVIAPFPTIPIAFPFTTPTAPVPAPSPPPVPDPLPPVLFDPNRPTIPIAFPLGPTEEPSFAPVPTIPIAFPL